MIRDARIGDLPQLIPLARRLIAKTPYRNVELDRESFTKAYGHCLSSQLGFAKVAEREGELTGALLGVASTLWWSKARYTSDLGFYSERAGDGLRMLRAFVAWSWSIPRVVDITCAQSSGIAIQRSGAIYRRAGFTKVGDLWCMSKS